MTYLTIEEAAVELRMTEDGLRRRAAGGKVPARKVGRRWLFHPELLDKYVKNEWHSTNEEPAEVGGSDSLYAVRLFDEAPAQQIARERKSTKPRSGPGTGGRRS